MPNDTNAGPAGGDTNTNAGPSFEEILQFDPFDGGASNEPPPQEPAEGGNEPQTPPGDDNAEGQQQEEPTVAAPQQAAAPAAPPKPVSQADLESLIRQQTDVIASAINRPQPQQTQQHQPKFNLAIPDPLLAALRSEDPGEFKAGVGALINSLANHVWDNFRQAVQTELMPMLPRMIEQYSSNVREQESVGRDFYGTYPQLQNPMFAPMIQTVGAAIAEEYARAGRSINWGPELRDAIAERIFTVLPQLRGQQQQQPQGRQQRRSFSTSNGARPPQRGDTSQDDMMAMIFGPQN